jgi:hypothetical protein
MAVCEGEFSNQISKPSLDAFDNKFKLLIGLISKSKMELEGMN